MATESLGMTADLVRLAIVGCGGMGRRHLAGLAELTPCGEHVVDPMAVCDLNDRNAIDLADEAHVLLGVRLHDGFRVASSGGQ
jgi:predicted dehydrogenase